MFVLPGANNKKSSLVQEITWYQTGKKYCQVSNIRDTLVGNKIVDTSDVVGASPLGAAPTTSPLST